MSELASDSLASGLDDWTRCFESVLKTFSEGEFEKELMRAKNLFFLKLGRSHEMQESFYNAVSQSFLEWYLFDYQLSARGKTPALCFLALGWGTDEERAWVSRALYHYYSWYRVAEFRSDEVLLEDLLFSKTRSLRYDKEAACFQSWRVEKDQLIQARLFRERDSDQHHCTHVWIHLDSERKSLLNLASQKAIEWGLHREMLRECLECVIRSYDLSDQLAAVRSQNWVFRDFYKNYLKGRA